MSMSVVRLCSLQARVRISSLSLYRTIRNVRLSSRRSFFLLPQRANQSPFVVTPHGNLLFSHQKKKIPSTTTKCFVLWFLQDIVLYVFFFCIASSILVLYCHHPGKSCPRIVGFLHPISRLFFVCKPFAHTKAPLKQGCVFHQSWCVAIKQGHGNAGVFSFRTKLTEDLGKHSSPAHPKQMSVRRRCPSRYEHTSCTLVYVLYICACVCLCAGVHGFCYGSHLPSERFAKSAR